jgi:hypothetical protein
VELAVSETEAPFRRPAVQELGIPDFRHLRAAHRRRLSRAHHHLYPQAEVAASKEAPSVRRHPDRH